MKILSLGAGVQSSTIFLMSCYREIEKVDAAIFADTGWEPAAVYEWLKFLQTEGSLFGIPIYVVQQGNIKHDALSQTSGKRAASMPYFTRNINSKTDSMVRRQCTYEYKLRSLEKKTRELAGYQPRQRIPAGTVEIWKGISTDEKQRVKLSEKKWIELYYPLIELRMSRQDCLIWFDKKNIPRPPRSACLGCPYHSNMEWRHIRDKSPAEWAEVVAFDKSIRKNSYFRDDIYLHAARVPLDEVDLTTLEDLGQINAFDNECAGVCGV